jgi:hypothetical protein
MKTEVPVERYIGQVVEGVRYSGYLKIGGVTLDHNIEFGIPIGQLKSVEPAETEEEIRQRFAITIKRGGEDVRMTMLEYSFFFSMLVHLAIEFYENQQNRGNNAGLLGSTIRNEVLMSDTIRASISMTSNVSCYLSQELCQTLSEPKFGCKF